MGSFYMETKEEQARYIHNSVVAVAAAFLQPLRK